MILELVLDLIKALFKFVLGIVPNLPIISLPLGFVAWFTNLLSTVSYFLPVNDFLAMFGIWIAFKYFTLNWKVVQRIWDALPFT